MLEGLCISLGEEGSLQLLILPHCNITIVTCSCQDILGRTDIYAKNPIRMPLQRQLANTTIGVPYSYTTVRGTSHNPLSVIREQRNG